jgi:hypothetical protein
MLPAIHHRERQGQFHANSRQVNTCAPPPLAAPPSPLFSTREFRASHLFIPHALEVSHFQSHAARSRLTPAPSADKNIGGWVDIPPPKAKVWTCDVRFRSPSDDIPGSKANVWTYDLPHRPFPALTVSSFSPRSIAKSPLFRIKKLRTQFLPTPAFPGACAFPGGGGYTNFQATPFQCYTNCPLLPQSPVANHQSRSPSAPRRPLATGHCSLVPRRAGPYDSPSTQEPSQRGNVRSLLKGTSP